MDKACDVTIDTLQEDNPNTITAIATDRAGNASAEATLTVTVKSKKVADVFPTTNFGEADPATGNQSGGPYVEYVSPEGYSDINGNGTIDDWRLFYNDGQDVFLIAAEIASKIPRNLVGGLENDTTCCVRWNTGASNLWTWADEVCKLFLHPECTNSWDTNLKCVSTLLYPSNWEKYVNQDYADHAIGAPTLEMWQKSWNAHDETTYPRIYTKTSSSSSPAYWLGASPNPSTCTLSLYGCEGGTNELYFGGNNRWARTYWLASAAGTGSEKMMAVYVSNPGGSITDYDCDYGQVRDSSCDPSKT